MKKITIGLPSSPGKIVSKKTSSIKEVKVSYGGGMGGANTTFYGKVVSENKGFITLRDHKEKELEINKRFIVWIKDVQLIKVTFDLTEHANYNKKTCESYVVTEYYALDTDCKCEFTKKYIPKEIESFDSDYEKK
jgi:hypothetical protein